MLSECHVSTSGLHLGVDVLPQVVVPYVNQARPEGATLIIQCLCSWDTGLSQSADNLPRTFGARRLLPSSALEEA